MATKREKKELLERLEAEYPGYHPVVAMARMAHTTKSERMKFECHKEIARYVEPQLKAVEVTGNIAVGTGVMRVPPQLTHAEWVDQAKLVSINTKSIIDAEVIDDDEG